MNSASETIMYSQRPSPNVKDTLHLRAGNLAGSRDAKSVYLKAQDVM